jgi:hypothetical protein
METWESFDTRDRSGMEEVLHLAVVHIARKSKKEEAPIWDDLVQTALGVERKSDMKCSHCGASVIELRQTSPSSVKCNVCGKETVFTENIDITPTEDEVLSDLSAQIASEAPKVAIKEPKPAPVEARSTPLVSGKGEDKLAAQRAAAGNPLIDASDDTKVDKNPDKQTKTAPKSGDSSDTKTDNDPADEIPDAPQDVAKEDELPAL